MIFGTSGAQHMASFAPRERQKVLIVQVSISGKYPIRLPGRGAEVARSPQKTISCETAVLQADALDRRCRRPGGPALASVSAPC